MKNFLGILIGITLNLKIAFGRIAIFPILVLPIQEQGRSFHFLVSSSISFGVGVPSVRVLLSLNNE